MENGNSYTHGGTVGGTIGGTLLVFLLQINVSDIFKTCVLAAVGAVVSYLVSLCLKWFLHSISNRIKRHQKNRNSQE